jgi:hypothetical protein
VVLRRASTGFFEGHLPATTCNEIVLFGVQN